MSDASEDSKVNAVNNFAKYLKESSSIILQDLKKFDAEFKETDFKRIVNAESLVEMLGNLLESNWENFGGVQGARIKDANIADKKWAELNNMVGKITNVMTFKTHDKVDKTLIAHKETGNKNDFYNTNIYKFVNDKSIVYLLDAKSRLTDLTKDIDNLARINLLQGASLFKLKIETFKGAYDSSGATYKMRKDGTQSNQKRGKDSAIKYTTENLITAHMVGHSLSGRMQKSVRTNVGVGISLCVALGAKIKLLSKTGSNEEQKFTKQTLDSAINACAAKLCGPQLDVLGHLQTTNMEEKAVQCFKLLASSLDAIWPKVDVPCLPHPVYLFRGDVFRIKNLYHTKNLTCMEQKLLPSPVPGFISSLGVRQALQMAGLGSLYAPLAFTAEFFGGDPKQRDELVQELKFRHWDEIPGIKLLKADALLSHFQRGAPSAVKHQSILHIPAKNNVGSFYVHNLPLDKGLSVRAPLMGALRAMTTTLSSNEKLQSLRDARHALDMGSWSYSGDTRRGYFNNVSEQSEDARKEIAASWVEMSKLVFRSDDDLY